MNGDRFIPFAKYYRKIRDRSNQGYITTGEIRMVLCDVFRMEKSLHFPILNILIEEKMITQIDRLKWKVLPTKKDRILNRYLS